MPCCETRMFYVMMLLQRGCSGLSSATGASFFLFFIVQQKNVTMCTLCTYSDIGFNVWSLFYCDAGIC